jgi:amidase
MLMLPEDAHAQAALLREGSCSALDLVNAAIERIERLDGQLNAISVRAFEQARARAALRDAAWKLTGGRSGERADRHAGTLAGVPYLLKDSIDYPGMPSACGSRALASRRPMTRGYAYVERLDALGLIPLGKTNVPEFSLLPSTEGTLFGSARNPWSLDRSPGGSSGGSAVAVAAGMVPLAHAADGGGSIRIPASCCGLVGLKASRGTQLRARAPHVIEDLLVADGLLARSVRDVRWAHERLRPSGKAVAGPRPGGPLRIGVVESSLFGDIPHPHVSATLRQTADLCSGLGHSVAVTRWPVDGPSVMQAFKTLWTYLGYEIVAHLRSSMEESQICAQLEEWTLGLSRVAPSFAAEDAQGVFEQAEKSRQALESWFDSFDLMLTPVVLEPPPRIGRYSPGQPFETLYEQMFRYVSFTPLQNLSGHPAISVPLYRSPEGLPIGSMFTARLGGDKRLLELAAQLERARTWAHEWPPHSASAPA